MGVGLVLPDEVLQVSVQEGEKKKKKKKKFGAKLENQTICAVGNANQMRARALPKKHTASDLQPWLGCGWWLFTIR